MNRALLSIRFAFLASAVGVAGFCVAAAPTREVTAYRAIPVISPLTAAPDDGDGTGRDGAYKSDDEHRKDIRWLLADISDRAARDDGWNRVSDWLSSKDRHRIVDGLGAAKTGDYAKFARAFREAWHNKYDSEFNAHASMDDITGVKIEFSTKDARKFAIATFPAFGGMQAFEMRLQLEAKNKWRIEIPNDVDAADFISRLQDGLKNIVSRPDSLFKEEKLGLNSAITQMLHGLSYEVGSEKASKKRS